jgi:hypothetical protein
MCVRVYKDMFSLSVCLSVGRSVCLSVCLYVSYAGGLVVTPSGWQLDADVILTLGLDRGLTAERGAAVRAAALTPFLDLRGNHITALPSGFEQRVAACGGSVLLSPVVEERGREREEDAVGAHGGAICGSKRSEVGDANPKVFEKGTLESDASWAEDRRMESEAEKESGEKERDKGSHLVQKEGGHVFEFYGELKHGVENSRGKRVYNGGWTLETTWVDGTRVGEGTATRRVGDTVKETWRVEYKGDVVAGQALGEMSDGSRYEGQACEIVSRLRKGPLPGTIVEVTSGRTGAPPHQAMLELNRGDELQIGDVREHMGEWFATSIDDPSRWFPVSSTDWDPEVDGTMDEKTILSAVNFLPHGEGVMISSDGAKYEGTFEEGKFAGRGMYQWPGGITDAPRYQGEFLDGKLHGAGVLVWPSGDKFTGQFQRSCPEKGVLEKPGESTKVGSAQRAFIDCHVVR